MSEPNHTPFVFVNLTGSSYEIGRQQGEVIRTIPGWAGFMSSTPMDWSDKYLNELKPLYSEFCPGMLDEIQGLADAMQIKPEQVVYHSTTYLIPPRCSHFVVLPRLTENGHTLVGRSYEFGPDSDDKRLCLTQVQGKFRHIGNSSIMLGRLDGMNEHGLTVTMSAGGIPVSNLPGLRPPEEKGLQFWAAIRSVLENCQDVPEGLDLIKRFPFCGNPILILADAQGNAAKVEIFGSHQVVERIGPTTNRGYLCAANHFIQPAMEQFQPAPKKNSLKRVELIENHIQAAGTKLNQESITRLLSTQYPDGLCCHFYKEYFGTLYSLVLDPMDRQMSICFGSPAVNPWHKFDFETTIPFQTYQASLPQADGFNEFWG